jgi:beta-N-acetylhexosaminidase
MKSSILPSLFLFAVSIFLFFISLFLRDPVLLKFRLLGLIAINLVGIIWFVIAVTHRHKKDTLKNFYLILVILAMAISVGKESSFQFKKYFVLNYDKKNLATLANHIIVGFHGEKELSELLTLPVFGFFVTHHNVKGLSIQGTKNLISKIQNNRKLNNFPNAFIATDQEGGQVSRLSPPLKLQSSLGEILTANPNLPEKELEEQVVSYAKSQAEELKTIGVNINFSPILDLKYEKDKSPFDLYSRIYNRAIASDPNKVSFVAEVYSRKLLEYKIIPTLKHFPGLGRVSEDTHFFNANLATPLNDLENSDLIPFMHIAHNIEYPLIMLSHSTVLALDNTTPISISEKGIQEYIRPKFPVTTVLITDDMNMGPTMYRKGGIGQSAVSGLNAGLDILLISYDGEQIYEVLYSLIKANNEGILKLDRLKESEKRLQRFINFSFLPNLEIE